MLTSALTMAKRLLYTFWRRCYSLPVIFLTRGQRILTTGCMAGAPKMAPSSGDLGSHLRRGSLGPLESTCQTASRSVHPFCRTKDTHRYRCRHFGKQYAVSQHSVHAVRPHNSSFGSTCLKVLSNCNATNICRRKATCSLCMWTWPVAASAHAE